MQTQASRYFCVLNLLNTWSICPAFLRSFWLTVWNNEALALGEWRRLMPEGQEPDHMCILCSDSWHLPGKAQDVNLIGQTPTTALPSAPKLYFLKALLNQWLQNVPVCCFHFVKGSSFSHLHLLLIIAPSCLFDLNPYLHLSMRSRGTFPPAPLIHRALSAHTLCPDFTWSSLNAQIEI